MEKNKKRGRKPKGGKIIKTNIRRIGKKKKIKEQNIILHLKCSVKDTKKQKQDEFKYDPNVNEIKAFESSIKNLNAYEFNKLSNKSVLKKEKKKNDDVHKKLRDLQKKLHFNNTYDKKSDCFWCTYPFDNQPIYIPARIRDKSIEVYGCFCCPECAVGYLNKENIDSSTRWERYALLNSLYGKLMNYKKNIKPSPDPFYTLEKFYGNLTIKEYRKLLTNNNVLLVLNKPLTKILPELHEEKDDISINCGSFHSKEKEPFFKPKRKNLKKKKLSENFNFY